MADATMLRKRGSVRKVAAASIAAGELHSLPDGRAGWKTGLNAAATSDTVTMNDDENTVIVTKATGVTLLDGQEVFWDHSANAATYKTADDKDFYVGTAVGDAGNSTTTVNVRLNNKPTYLIDLRADAFRDVPVTANTTNRQIGGATRLALSAANEAQKTDLLSDRGFSVNSNWIVEAVVNVVDGGAGAAPDFNVGIANATHATSFDSVGRYLTIHIDGNSANINAQSTDGTTTVAATDTTIDYTANTTFHVVMDGRNPADVQIYINGALVLGSTVFDISAATQTLKAIVHLEKTAATDVFDVYVDRLTVRIADDGTTP